MKLSPTSGLLEGQSSNDFEILERIECPPAAGNARRNDAGCEKYEAWMIHDMLQDIQLPPICLPGPVVTAFERIRCSFFQSVNADPQKMIRELDTHHIENFELRILDRYNQRVTFFDDTTVQ